MLTPVATKTLLKLRTGQELLLRNQHHWLKNVHIRGCADGHNGGSQLISFIPFH